MPAQWEHLRQISEECKQKPSCQIKTNPIREERPLTTFSTGSSYLGTWDTLGMCGHGTYRYPHGPIYEGEFDDGMFHGQGQILYPCGVVVRGKWRQGEMYERTIVFADGLEYSEHNFKYCEMPDRRFTVEYSKGLQPGTASIRTADQPTRDIPLGSYDTCDGFYDPKTKMVFRYDDLTFVERRPDEAEQKWIEANCRCNPDHTVGPRPDLYEQWQEPKLVSNVDPELSSICSDFKITKTGSITFDENESDSNMSCHKN